MTKSNIFDLFSQEIEFSCGLTCNIYRTCIN